MIIFDFDGVFTDNRVLTMQDGNEGVFCCRSDGIGLSALRNVDVKLFVISTETNPVTGVRCNKLKLDYIQNCTDKPAALRRITSEFAIPLEKTAHMGNDINDLECLKIVGIPVCVRDSHKDIIPFCKYVTRKKGGYGAVREFCDLVLKNRKLRH